MKRDSVSTGRGAGEAGRQAEKTRGQAHPSVTRGRSSVEAVDRTLTLREGWRLYGEERLDEAGRLVMAEAARSPDDPEAAYLLGMIFKAQGEAGHAAKAFSAAERTAGNVADHTRAEMLRRLAQAHLEMLNPAASEETN